MHNIVIMGLGYIGLPTAVAFALAGHNVVGVDIRTDLVAQLNQGKIDIDEPELAEKLQQAHQMGRFIAKTTPVAAEVFIIAVPTPLSYERRADLSAVYHALENLAPVLAEENLIILESTSPVGTTEKLAAYIRQLRPDLQQLHFAYCPERILPSQMMREIYGNDRIIGGLTSQATEYACKLYRSFVVGECVATNARTAELCKLAENSFRDVNIAFANELSMLCQTLNVDVWELIQLANRHPRVNILQPSAGVGGHCIAVDPWFIVEQAPMQSQLIKTARQVNDFKPQWVLEQVKIALAERAMQLDKKPSEMVIACLGIAFKANVADLRESPALAICTQLGQWHQGKLWIVEPNITQFPSYLQNSSELVPLEKAYKEADLLIELVAHREFMPYTASNLISFVRPLVK